MANQIEASNEPSVTSLVTGIVRDAQELMKQQLTLFGHELRRDVDKAKEGVSKMAVGAVVCLIGGLMLAIMLALALDALIPAFQGNGAWAGFAAVGAVVLAVGVVLLLLAPRDIDEVKNPVDETVHALKENVEWTTRPK